MEDGSWDEYRRKVISELERAHDERVEIRSRVDRLSIEVAGQKVRLSLWGGVAGALVALVTAITTILVS